MRYSKQTLEIFNNLLSKTPIELLMIKNKMIYNNEADNLINVIKLALELKEEMLKKAKEFNVKKN